jgi:hypothetical protein
MGGCIAAPGAVGGTGEFSSARERCLNQQMPNLARERLSLELRLTAVAIGAAVLFTAFALLWRFAYDGAWWRVRLPPVPRMRGFEAFGLYAWIEPLGGFVALLMVLAILVRWVTGWRGPTAWIGVGLPVLVCVTTAMMYAPFRYLNEQYLDRVGGRVEAPIAAAMAMADTAVSACVLAAAFICVTRMRRTHGVVRYAALTVAATLTAVMLSVGWILTVLPAQSGWTPYEWRSDLLVRFRPCRGALLWQASAGEPSAYPFARIDDLWLHFDDPRTPGARVWAISAKGEWQEGYLWLTRAEAETLLVRRDDPMVVRCDSRVRSDSRHLRPGIRLVSDAPLEAADGGFRGVRNGGQYQVPSFRS